MLGLGQPGASSRLPAGASTGGHRASPGGTASSPVKPRGRDAASQASAAPTKSGSTAPAASVLIPCYNAAQWLREAVDSSLQQAGVEVVVVDDGSTDESVRLLEGYGDAIVLEAGRNRGANVARNRAFELSSGRFIQYLDADDYLLPGKIERQVEYLEETGTDVVYGDWRYEFIVAGRRRLGPVNIAGEQEDIVEALLSPWWFPSMSPLYRRSIVAESEGWDESLRTGQDRAFSLSVALAGASFRYQPGCYSVYRRYGDGTLSATTPLWLHTTRSVLEDVEGRLGREGELTTARKAALARTYFDLARKYYRRDRTVCRVLLARCYELGGDFTVDQPKSYRVCQRLMGFRGAEMVGTAKRTTLDVTSGIRRGAKRRVGALLPPSR